MDRPKGWLTENDELKARDLERAVEAQWHLGPETFEYTPHDLKHFRRVEDWIRSLIPRENWPALSDEERKILTWGAWTHDIGMFTSHFPQDTAAAEIRKLHPEQAAEWVTNKWTTIGLDRMEAQVLADLLPFHSRSRSLKECPLTRLCVGSTIRPRLIAAYLRLADALDVTHDRVEEPYRFNLLVRQISSDSDETLFHWVKSFVVSAIAVDHRHQEICVQFIQYNGSNQRHFELIKRYVINEIEDELASVEKTLSAGGLSSFHSIRTMDEMPVRGPLQIQLASSIERVLGWAQMTQSPNSTAVTIAALGAIRALIEETGSLQLKSPTHAWNTLRSGLQRLKSSLLHQLRQRRCHNELSRIFNSLTAVERNCEFKDEFDEQVVSSLSQFANSFEKLVRPDQGRDSLLASQLSSFLQSSRPRTSSGNQWTFVLMGCSETVARALAEFGKDQQLNLIVAEGRPKAQHGAHNVPSYVDAEAYVERLHSSGLRASQLYIIPDACVASTMDRGAASNGLPSIDAVIVGANGIYFEPEVRVAHSAGHLMCAISAKHFGIPVVVLTSATKISAQAPDRSDRQSRKSKWLCSDEELLERLEKQYGAKTDWNPREDRIPFELIAAIITDRGTILLNDVHAAKTELEKQMKEVDDALSIRAGFQSPLILR